jgi:hypothetical protein
MMSFKKVFEYNEGKMTIPGVENPVKSFSFIQEFMNSEINNGLVTFSNAQSAKDNLRKQLAHIFGDLLKNRFDPIKGEIKDILSEISTLKHILLKNEKEIAEKFYKAFRFLLDEKNKYLKEVSECISGSLENAVQGLLDASSFRDYLNRNNVEVKEVDISHFHELYRQGESVYMTLFKDGIAAVCHGTLPYETIRTQSTMGAKPDYDVPSEYGNTNKLIFAYGSKKFWADKNTFKLFEAIYRTLKSEL